VKKNKKKVVVIGGGFAGMASAALLASKGFDVTLLEKNKTLGGRAMSFSEKGFTFDMGPSWYMMSEVFERYFSHFNKKPSDFYKLKKLDPKYRIIFSKNEMVDMVNDRSKNFKYFESIEPGSSKKIELYLQRASEMYKLGMDNFVYKNYDSVFDLFDIKLAKVGIKLPLFENMHQYISRFVNSEKLRKILLYTTVFIGGVPKKTPALYTLMSHVDFNQDLHYPLGGMVEVVKALESLCKELGVKIKTNAPVSQINVKDSVAIGVKYGKKIEAADYVISNADYAFTEMTLLSKNNRSYNQNYWKKRTVAPSAFILYLGVKGKIPQFRHHTLFFVHDWESHFESMYDKQNWPEHPSMYICNPSKTDPSVAPKDTENLFILVPIAPGLSDNEEIRKKYRDKIIKMIDEHAGTEIEKNILYEKTLTINDYKSLYNSYRGTALGLAPTFLQTAVFRPPNKSKKVKNLYYAGQNTVPGVGVPMALISAELAVNRVLDDR
jgi:phytoene desaturase